MASTSALAPADAPVSGTGGALAALVAGALAMGISPVVVRLVGAEVGPFASAFWRVVLALPVLYAWMRVEARSPRAAIPLGRGALAASLFAGVAFAGDLFLWHLAIRDTTIANATFLATMAPVFVVAISFVALRRRTAPAVLAGLAACLVGGAALIGQTLQVAPGRLVGDLEGLGTAFFFGLYFLFVERARAAGYGAARVTFIVSLVTTALLACAVAAFETRPLLPSTATGLAMLLVLALVSHAAGQGLLSLALGRLPVAFSSLVIFLEAIAAAGLAWAILGEALTPPQLMGGALILAGIWIARPRAARAKGGGRP